MESALFDTSVYVAALRRGDISPLLTRWRGPESPLWLSAVVLEELYAGANEGSRDLVEQLERDFERIGRILVPNLTDWTGAGQILNRLAAKYDYEQIGRARLTSDALIAMSARRLGIRIITANERDFRRLAEFRTFQWEIATF